MYVQACEGVCGRVSKAADISRAVRIVILPESIFSKMLLISLSLKFKLKYPRVLV